MYYTADEASSNECVSQEELAIYIDGKCVYSIPAKDSLKQTHMHWTKLIIISLVAVQNIHITNHNLVMMEIV